MLPYQLVHVSGPSMVPTLRNGDLVLVRRRGAVHPGDVVLGRFGSMPDRLVLKRAVAACDGGWLLRSDNDFAGGDSRSHGVAEVFGRVLLVWSRTGSGRRRLRPQRVRR